MYPEGLKGFVKRSQWTMTLLVELGLKWIAMYFLKLGFPGESLSTILYGQKYLLEKFHKHMTCILLPDTFGYSVSTSPKSLFKT
jgi:hypothetical protein